jgi:hypothetical protein
MATKSNVRTKISAPLVRFVLVTRKEDDRRVVSASMTSSAGFVSAYFFRKKKTIVEKFETFHNFFRRRPSRFVIAIAEKRYIHTYVR